MLNKSTPEAMACMRGAFEAHCRAGAAADARTREFWNGMERRWLLLASSIECVGRINACLAELDRGPLPPLARRRDRRPRSSARTLLS